MIIWPLALEQGRFHAKLMRLSQRGRMKRFASKFFVCVAFAAAMSLPVLKAQPTEDKIPLKLFTMPDPKNPSPFAQADMAVFRAFLKKHPDIEPFAFTGISIAGRSLDSTSLLAIAGGNAPDVLYVNFRQSDTYIRQGFLYPLDGFLANDMDTGRVSQADMDERIVESIRPVVWRDGPAIGGNPSGRHLWAMPYNLLVRVLAYRKDLFASVGLDPEKPPQTWKELYGMSRRMADPANGRYGMYIASGPHAAWDWMAYLWSAGGDAVVQDGSGNWIAAFDSPAAVAALDFYLKLVCERWTDADGSPQRGYVLRSADEAGTAWEEGRIGMRSMYLDEKSIAQGIDPSIIGIAPFPVGPAGLRGGEINCEMMGIFSDIQDRRNAAGILVPAAKIREAAWRYISFYDSDEARKIRVDKLIELGCGQLLNPIWLRKYGYADYAKFVPPEWERVFVEAIKSGKPEPYGRNCQQIYDYMTVPIEESLQLARTDESFMKDEARRLKTVKSLLSEAVEKTNTNMLGTLSKEERQRRSLVAGIVTIVVAALFSFLLYRVWVIITAGHSGTKGHRWEFRKYSLAYLILLPALASIALWCYVPMFLGSRIAFLDYRFVGESEFTGLDNVAAVLYSADWWMSLWHTLRYMFLSLALGFLPPILLAILLQEVSRWSVVYRVIYYLPAMMSSLVVIYLWRLFFEPGGSGAMNQIFLFLAKVFGFGHAEPIAWLEDPSWAMLCCVLPGIWAGTGPGCLIYLAALKGIPDELYEAASIDGAGFLRKVVYIVVPYLKPLIAIQFVGAFVAASQNTQIILVMTYGSAGTEVAGLHIFKEAYMSLRFGTAISMAWMLGVTLLVFTVYQLQMLSKMEFKAEAVDK